MQLMLHRGPYTAAVDTRGGELVSFRDNAGTEYIWRGDPNYWSGQNPVLFPIVGSLKNGRVRFGSQEYEMARHGFARRSNFSVVEQGDAFVVFQLRENPGTLAQYPFPFLLRVRHQLLEGGFSTAFEVTNTGDAPLPFCIGAHTAFNCPLCPEEEFRDYRLVFDEMEDADSLIPTAEGLLAPGRLVPLLRGTDTIALDHGLFDRLDTLIFDGLRSKGVCLIHKDSGRGVRMEFAGFPIIAFWTMPHADAPYLCLEPWHGCPAWDNESGDFADKSHCIILQPGERRELRYTVLVL